MYLSFMQKRVNCKQLFPLVLCFRQASKWPRSRSPYIKGVWQVLNLCWIKTMQLCIPQQSLSRGLPLKVVIISIVNYFQINITKGFGTSHGPESGKILYISMPKKLAYPFVSYLHIAWLMLLSIKEKIGKCLLACFQSQMSCVIMEQRHLISIQGILWIQWIPKTTRNEIFGKGIQSYCILCYLYFYIHICCNICCDNYIPF